MQEIKEFSLGDNEKIIRIVRHHPIIVIPHLVVCFFILILDFFLMYYLFLQGWWGVILFCSILVVIGLYCLRIFFLFRKNKFIITNLRVIDFEQTGFFEKFINEFTVSKIKEVEIKVRGILPTIFRFGNLKLSLMDDIAPFEFYKVPRPAELQQIINKVREANPEQKKEELLRNDPASLVLAEVRLLSDRQKKDLVRRIQGEIGHGGIASSYTRVSVDRSVDNSGKINNSIDLDDEDGI